MNSVFQNMGIFDHQTPWNDREVVAIFARNDGIANKQTTVIGLNQMNPSSPPNTFSNCYRDIRTTGTNLSVMDVTSYKSGSSIRAIMANSWQNPISCQIKNNKIDYFRAIGIEISYLKPITINIENNKIFDNNALSDQPLRYGIRLNNDSNSEIILKGSRIFNNEIRSRSTVAGGNFWGIALDMSSYLTIEQNDIFDNLPQTNIQYFNGIRTAQSPCNGLRILYNNINGAKIDYTEGFGVFLSESINSILSCNSFDKTNTGLGFFSNCNNADVRKNLFHLHNKGLALGDPLFPPLVNEIGIQSKKENRWYYTSSPIEAFALNQPSATSSIFEINSSNLNSIFWPTPRKIGSVDDNFIWFVPATSGPEANDDEIACFITYPGPRFEIDLARTDIDLLNDTYQPPLGFPAKTWEAQWEFADRLNRNPDLLQISTDVSEYYETTYNETFSALNRVYQGYLNRWQPNNPLTEFVENSTVTLNNTIEQRFALDALLSANSEQNASLYQQMLNADMAIANASNVLYIAVNDLHYTINQEIDAMLIDVDNIKCTTEYEKDMKAVIQTMLASHQTNGNLSPEQITSMVEIADKCRYSGGYAVLLARGFFEPQDSYIQDVSCEPEQRNSSIQQDHPVKLEVFPNPTSQSLRINIPEQFEMGIVHMYNSQGILVNRFEIQSQSTMLSINNLKNGIYFIELRLDQKPAIRKSVVINQ